MTRIGNTDTEWRFPSNCKGPVAFLTSEKLMNDFILLDNVYTMSFKEAPKTFSKRASVPNFTPELEGVALADLESGFEHLQTDRQHQAPCYSRIRKYLVSLFTENEEDSTESFDELRPLEKALIRTNMCYLVNNLI